MILQNRLKERRAALNANQQEIPWMTRRRRLAARFYTKKP